MASKLLLKKRPLTAILCFVCIGSFIYLLHFLPTDEMAVRLGLQVKCLWTWYLTMSLFSFLLFAVDKHRAQATHTTRSRIPERTLLVSLFLGGMVGGLAGMVFCRHKTLKQMFWVSLNGAFLLHCFLPVLAIKTLSVFLLVPLLIILFLGFCCLVFRRLPFKT